MLLIVAHAVRHVQTEPESRKPQQQAAQLEVTPEVIDLLLQRLAESHTTVVAETPEPKQLAAPLAEQSVESQPAPQEEQGSTFERVQAYLAEHPQAKIREVAEALSLSMSTANKWMKKVQKAERA